MKALYQHRLCVMVETTGDVAILAHGPDTFAVPLGSVELVVDPTDAQVAGADDAPSTDVYTIRGARAPARRNA